MILGMTESVVMHPIVIPANAGIQSIKRFLISMSPAYDMQGQALDWCNPGVSIQ